MEKKNTCLGELFKCAYYNVLNIGGEVTIKIVSSKNKSLNYTRNFDLGTKYLQAIFLGQAQCALEISELIHLSKDTSFPATLKIHPSLGSHAEILNEKWSKST